MLEPKALQFEQSNEIKLLFDPDQLHRAKPLDQFITMEIKMKTSIRIFLFPTILALSACANVQGDTTPKSASGMACPMMADASAMQKDMGGMMKDMSAMMDGTSDPAMKARMMKMHEHMTAMMTHMKKMDGGMGGMMGGGAMKGGKHTGKAPAAAPLAATDDHDAHHPKP